jgi:hypothetical protein
VPRAVVWSKARKHFRASPVARRQRSRLGPSSPWQRRRHRKRAKRCKALPLAWDLIKFSARLGAPRAPFWLNQQGWPCWRCWHLQRAYILARPKESLRPPTALFGRPHIHLVATCSRLDRPSRTCTMHWGVDRGVGCPAEPRTRGERGMCARQSIRTGSYGQQPVCMCNEICHRQLPSEAAARPRWPSWGRDGVSRRSGSE